MDKIIVKKLSLIFFLIVFSLYFSATYAKWFVVSSVGPTWFNKDNGYLTISKGVGGHKDLIKQERLDRAYAYHLGFGYGINFNRDPYLETPSLLLIKDLKLSLDAYYNSQFDISGSVYQYKMTTMDNYIFNMKSSSKRAMINLTVDLNFPYRVIPYVLVGVGASWNTVNLFKEVPKKGIIIGLASCNKKTELNLSYQLGVGLKYLLTKQLSISAEYTYVDAGTMKTSKKFSSGSVIEGAKFKLQGNQILLGFGYTF